MRRSQFHGIIVTLTVVLSFASTIVVFKGANDEPYVNFQASDALVQVGVAMVLMVLLGQLAAGLIYGLVLRRISGWCWLLVIWAMICEFYLYHCPSGYVGDITQFWGQHNH